MKTLDTNICSYILRRQPRSVLEYFRAQPAESFFLSALVVAELRFGVVKRGSTRLSAQLEPTFRTTFCLQNNFLLPRESILITAS